MKINLDFLKEVSLTKTETRAPSLDTVPANGASLRVFKDGRVFPSAQFVKESNLEYVAKDDAIGNGLDIIDTEHFSNYPREAPRILMVAVTPKDTPKIDIFQSVGYNNDGSPKSSVLTQGSRSFGLTLRTMLEEVYGVTLDDNYVDLVITQTHGLTTPNNIYQLPTKVARGEKKGQLDYKRRTDITLWPLTILDTDDLGTSEDSIPNQLLAEIDPNEGVKTDHTTEDTKVDIADNKDDNKQEDY